MYTDGLVQDSRNAIVNAKESLQSCTKPSTSLFPLLAFNAQNMINSWIAIFASQIMIVVEKSRYIFN